ncbi:efflux RND transporter permease subunit [Methanosphaerula subterraneus]|uniref:efflux RND transporter permease subunit n=1 Tax=Methanosphaerula subterraneus TaxID=3350244 RepID=UPI003F87D18C
MRSVFEPIGRLISGHPGAVAVGYLCLLLIALYGTTMITMNTGSDTYMDKSTEDGILFDTYTQTFDSNAVVLLVESSDVLSPDIIQYMAQVETALRQQQYIGQVSSVADLMRQMNQGRLPTSEGEILAIEQGVPASVLAQYVPSKDTTMVKISLQQGLSGDRSTSVLGNIQSVISSIDTPPGVTISMTGNAAFNKEMQSEIGKSTAVLIGGAMLLMVLTLGLLFSYVSQRFLPVLVVAFGLILTFGIMGLAGLQLNLAVVGAFPIIIGLGIDYAIQFHARFDEEAGHSSGEEAAFTTITKTGPAVLYAMLATSLGFAALSISSVPMVRDFGFVSIIGVMICYVSSLICVPMIALLTGYKPKGAHQPSTGPGGYSRFLASTAVKIAHNPVPIILVAALVAFAGVQLDSSIPIDTNQNTFVPSDMPARLSLNKVFSMIGSTDPVPLYVTGGDLDDPVVLQWMDEFESSELAKHSEMLGVTSIASVIKQYNGGVLPTTGAGVDAVMARIPSSVRDQYLDGTSAALITFSTVRMEMPEKNSLKEQIIDEIAFSQPPAGIQVKPTGNFDMFTSLINDIASGKDRMTGLGFGLILVFLLLVYRKLDAATPLIPIIFIVGWNPVAMTILGLDYTPITAVLGSMTIGVAAEYTILIMERYLEEREKTGNVYDAIEQSVQKIGTAITVSGLATFFGFSALILSAFPIISNFGISTIVAVLFSLIGAIVVMPAGLALMDMVERYVQRHRTGVARSAA